MPSAMAPLETMTTLRLLACAPADVDGEAVVDPRLAGEALRADLDDDAPRASDGGAGFAASSAARTWARRRVTGIGAIRHRADLSASAIVERRLETALQMLGERRARRAECRRTSGWTRRARSSVGSFSGRAGPSSSFGESARRTARSMAARTRLASSSWMRSDCDARRAADVALEEEPERVDLEPARERRQNAERADAPQRAAREEARRSPRRRRHASAREARREPARASAVRHRPWRAATSWTSAPRIASRARDGTKGSGDGARDRPMSGHHRGAGGGHRGCCGRERGCRGGRRSMRLRSTITVETLQSSSR